MTDTRSRPENATALHTPGPWLEQSLHGDDSWNAADEDWISIYAAEHGEPTCPTPVAMVVTRADARLIAAAPELLEMCVEAKDEFEAVHRDCALARYKKCDVCAHILPELRAAIAKATGS